MFSSPCRTRMTFLTSAVVFTIVFAGVMNVKAQETRESLFLDTTLVPVVELSIRNIARSSKAETDPSPSTQHANNAPKTTVDTSDDDVHDRSSSVGKATMASSKDALSTVIDQPPSSFLHGASVHSNLALQTFPVGLPSPSAAWEDAVGLPFPSASWEAALMPSFTTASRSVTKQLIPSTVHEDSATSLKVSESSTVSLPDDPQQIDPSATDGIATPDTIDTSAVVGIATPDASDDGPDVSGSYMSVGKSSSGMQLNVDSKDLEKSASESAVVIPNTEFVTPTSWHIFDTESVSHAYDMLYDNQFDETVLASSSATPDATSTETDYGGFSSEVMVSGKTQQDQNRHMFAHSKRLDFVLQQRCNDDHVLLETFESLSGQLVRMLNNTFPLNENRSAFVCKRLFHLTVPVENMTDSMLKETIKNLTENFTFEDDFRLEKIYLYQNDHAKTVLYSADPTEQTVNFDEYTLSERELIAYIVAGISLATLIFIVLTCCCVRFLCKKQTTSLDLCDIPHLNLKLEDYKLTPIPRPTISFSEYGRELFNPSYSEHTPKLEDTILSQQHFAAEATAAGARESLSFPREMRTFGGKKSCSRVQSLDGRPNMRSGNGWISNSREKLSTDFEKRNSGFDNVAFRKWF